MISKYLSPKKEAYKSDHILLDKLTHEHDLRDLYLFPCEQVSKLTSLSLEEVKSLSSEEAL